MPDPDAQDPGRRKAHHRRRGRHGYLGQVRGDGRRRPDHYLQFRALPNGGTRIDGGLLPYGDANAIVAEMAREVLPIARNTPVLAGVCGTDPFRLMDVFLRELQAMGFSGVQNFPTVGLMDGVFRANLEETGMSYALEVEMIRAARGLGLFTCPYAFTPEEARAMAEAGADIIVAHVGLTTKGTIGAKTAISLDEAVRRVQAMRDAAVAARADVLCLCHGGPISEPEDAAYILKHTEGVAGFFGASSMERLPTEVAITEQVRRFKAIPIK